MEIEEFELRICEALSLQLNEVCVLITGSNNSVVLAVIKDSVSTSFTPEISSATGRLPSYFPTALSRLLI